ncbi:uncharacterized protein LOC144627679 [Crassostrea virginica]
MDLPPPINLPYGKDYHLFMSFCKEDEERAFLLFKELEEKYNLKCLYHIRDFTPGVTVTDNILNGIEKSMKIVYLVSQKFKENFMCKTEMLYGIMASHKLCENSMIPVLLENIEMPRELQTINYVDATLEGIDVSEKIYKACLFGASTTSILPNVITFQELFNGTPLRVLKMVVKWKRCIPVACFEEDLEMRMDISDEDRSRKIDDMCNALLDDLNSSKFITNYKLNSTKFLCRAWCIFLLGLTSLAVLPLLLYLIIEGDISEQALNGWSSSLVIVPIITVSCGYCGFWIRQVTLGSKSLERIIWKYLLNNYETLKVLPLLKTTPEDERKQIVILNYDTEECEKFCKFVLKNTLVDENEIQRTAKELIRKFIFENREKLAMWNDLEEYKYNRHNTFMQKKCICQYLEPTLYSRKTENV